MTNINTRKRTIGVNFAASGEAQVLLWAPDANQVELLIPGKDKTVSLTCKDLGYWIAQTTDLQSGDLYYFELDGKKQLPDPASLSQPDDVHGASRAIDINSFQWKDDSWQHFPLKDYIIYELHVGTFTPEGTFAAAEMKLDYLVDLGITAVEIMPVAQFPGNRNWGYDGVYPFCVQHSYGGLKGLQSMVDACHSKGLAVILDVVFNHVGPEGNHLEEFGPYFTEKYRTPWGNAINFDDAWCDGVRDFFIENAVMWFRDFHIDALRMDAVHAIKDFSPEHILQKIKQQVDILIQQTGRKHYLIVELDLNDTRFINPVSKAGYGMDAQWIDEFHHALRVTSGQEKTGYYSDFDGIRSLAKSYEDAYVYDGAFSEHRKKVFGMKTENSGEQFVVFSQNHDHVGNRMLGERTSQLVSFEMQKVLAGAVLVSPYLPLLFMGEEYGEKNPFQYFVSHTDPEIVEMVRKGRKKEFEAFHMDGEAPDPVLEETFERSKLNWELIEKEPHQTMLNYYKELIATRKSQPPLCVLNRKKVSVEHNTATQVIVLRRQHKVQDVICLMNFSAEMQEVEVSLYAASWRKLLGSSDLQWGGSQDMPAQVSGELALILPPESITLYSNQYE
ncbi:malto-oligosyltrehalose trehalohydrolase [Dyadobacter sp. CY312]|uniref:malto-oligosyltrehalose trehalohydrolase n=1 Tax=Dyadobacter sp. CY312 TaxID=2907303 RepID=UPI001F176CE9|nr:malto-oligosyltrehalose trehalohydrolase [Dyadobacter sp. CY312]MCE7042888.1 malto-oligosyltrehalose trehalohydrolase [Dyadobacter sp. CY312]